MHRKLIKEEDRREITSGTNTGKEKNRRTIEERDKNKRKDMVNER